MYKLLVVDDEPYVRQGLKLLINQENNDFEVYGEAGNAFDALKLLKTESFDAAMIDIKMPKMDGLTLIRRIRDEGYLHLPVIILSGYFDYNNAKAAMDCDVVTYLLKPILPDHLEQALAKVKEQLKQQSFNRIDRNKNRLNAVTLYINQMLSGSISSIAEQELRRYFGNAKRFYYLRLELEEENEKSTNQLFKQGSFMQKHLYKAAYVQTPARAENKLTEYGLIITDLTLANRNMTLEEYAINLKQELIEAGFIGNRIYHGQAVNSVVKLSESYRTATGAISEIRNCSGMDLLVQIKEYMQAHFREAITISTISKHFYINSAYLGQLFKKHYGIYIKDYLNRLRCEEAKKLILDGDEKIYKIADMAGFSNVDHMIQVFNREMGSTPNKYRKNMTQAK